MFEKKNSEEITSEVKIGSNEEPKKEVSTKKAKEDKQPKPKASKKEKKEDNGITPGSRFVDGQRCTFSPGCKGKLKVVTKEKFVIASCVVCNRVKCYKEA